MIQNLYFFLTILGMMASSFTFAGSTANAKLSSGSLVCPDIVGKYYCDGDVTDFNHLRGPVVEIAQSGQIIWLPLVEFTPPNSEYAKYILDGKIYERVEEDSHIGNLKILSRALCLNKTIIAEDKALVFDPISGRTGPFFTTLLKVDQNNDKSIAIESTLTWDVGNHSGKKETSKSTCQKN